MFRVPMPWAVVVTLLGLAGAARAQPVVYEFEAANYWGHAYVTVKKATDPQACARRCAAESKCLVASFTGPNGPPNWANTCVLRNAVGSRHTEQPDIRSWVKPAMPALAAPLPVPPAPVPAPAPGVYRFERANYWGNNYLTIKNTRDPQACATRCAADLQCRVASSHGPRAPAPWANTCVLRSAIGPRHTEQPDIVSWIKP